MIEWIPCTKEEAAKVVAEYPTRLEHNYFMDSHSWHDFSDGQNKIVVMADVNYDSSELSWRIAKASA